MLLKLMGHIVTWNAKRRLNHIEDLRVEVRQLSAGIVEDRRTIESVHDVDLSKSGDLTTRHNKLLSLGVSALNDRIAANKEKRHQLITELSSYGITMEITADE